MVTLNHYLWVSGLLFALGIAGIVLRRNALVIFMALEMNLNAANLALVAFARYNHVVDAQVLVFFIIAIAAAEVAVGLAIIVALFRRKQTVSVDELNSMRL
ncbi:MAG: NADH-quinone oxidoreductase subunit NuoK [Verrucomicrobiae bacterium]|nr:NADH-quinone oxidoreductase subunit NuoK [Verrucomicrobiae bacterium]